MDREITTYSTLWSLVDLDETNHPVKELATWLLDAMQDWPTNNLENISQFIDELKEYFGTPLTTERIRSKKVHSNNLWESEAGSYIVNMIDISIKLYGEADIDKIVENLLNHYNEEFGKVDFIAELNYRTTEEGGRLTPAHSGYRPQVKFDFDEMQTSGQQTFINKEVVHPGETVQAKIKILSHDHFAGRLSEEMKFAFCEGSKVIGTGKIIYIVNGKLEKKG